MHMVKSRLCTYDRGRGAASLEILYPTHAHACSGTAPGDHWGGSLSALKCVISMAKHGALAPSRQRSQGPRCWQTER